MTSYSTALTQMSNRKRELEERLIRDKATGSNTSNTLTALAEVEKEIMSLQASVMPIDPDLWNCSCLD